MVVAGGVAVWRALPEGWVTLPRSAPTAAIPLDTYEVCFAPGEECTDAIVQEIRRARRSVLVQAYGFTSPEIAEALVRAQRRGVAVRVLLDSSAADDRYSVATFLDDAGIPVLVDDPPGIAHNKVMIIDAETVITGSFNFTRSAQERNAENVLVLRDQRLAAAYARNWERRQTESEPYDRAIHGTAGAEEQRMRRGAIGGGRGG